MTRIDTHDLRSARPSTFAAFAEWMMAPTMIALWWGTLVLGLWAFPSQESASVSWWAGVVGFSLLRMWLSTGLFITAHDAMHGVASKASRTWNNLLGRVALASYAFFPFDSFRRAHHRHHEHVASDDDPDFHSGDERFIPWLWRFVRTYTDWRPIVAFAVVANVAEHLLGVAPWRLWAFWFVPCFGSVIQLFTFGTWLPHRGNPGNEHHARTSNFGTFVSLLTCFHFVYHYEHHAQPHLAWWELPTARALKG